MKRVFLVVGLVLILGSCSEDSSDAMNPVNELTEEQPAFIQEY